MKYEGREWVAELTGSKGVIPVSKIYSIRTICDSPGRRWEVKPDSQVNNDILWHRKLEEIRQFRGTQDGNPLTEQEVERLIRIYNRYRHVFSDQPGKVRGYQCELKFKEVANFNKKSYPIAYAAKEAVRTEISKMMEEDIIEYSCSQYTSPIVAVTKKDGRVRLLSLIHI